MNRLVELPPQQQTPEQKKVFEQLVAGRGRILGPYKIWIHSPTVAAGMEHIGTYLNKKGSLSEREVEIGILVIAQHWDANYVRQAHIKMGKQVGLTQETIDAILAGRDPKLTDPHERAVHRFATSLVGGAKLSDAEFAEIEKAIGRNGVAEVLVLLGYYTSVSLGMHEGARGAGAAGLSGREPSRNQTNVIRKKLTQKKSIPADTQQGMHPGE
jgi:4-carboxymuconolactone decarboxylase